MSYFVTGATGFIGRNLVEGCCSARARSTPWSGRGPGAAWRSCAPLGSRRGAHRAGHRRPLPAGPRRLRGGPGDDARRDRPLLPPGGDLRHDRRRRDAGIANVEGTRHAVELAGAIEAGCFHQVSSIAAAGLYKGDLARGHVRRGRTARHQPLLPHQARVRAAGPRRVPAALAGLPAGDRRRRLAHRRDRQDRRPLLLLQGDAAAAAGAAVLAADGRGRRRRDQHRPGRLRRRGDRPHRPQAAPRRPRLPPHRPQPADRGRGDQPLRQGGRCAADGGAARHRRDRAGDRRGAQRAEAASRRPSARRSWRSARLGLPAERPHLRRLPDHASTRPRRRRR